MLMRHGYHFAKVSSHEQIIESNKAEYYKVLGCTQTTWKTDREDVSEWILFFLTVIKMQTIRAVELIRQDNFEQLLSEKQLTVWNCILSSPNELGRMSISEATGIPAITVESVIRKLLSMNKIIKLGQGRATRYRKT
jgi:Fic family protein